jgi:hypothetical protein
MEGDELAQIVAALDIVHQSSSTSQQRREAQDVRKLIFKVLSAVFEHSV